MIFIYPRIRPHHIILRQLIRPRRILRIRLAEERYVVGARFLPALVKVCVPEGEVPEVEDLPDAVFEDVVIFVDTNH